MEHAFCPAQAQTSRDGCMEPQNNHRVDMYYSHCTDRTRFSAPENKLHIHPQSVHASLSLHTDITVNSRTENNLYLIFCKWLAQTLVFELPQKDENIDVSPSNKNRAWVLAERQGLAFQRHHFIGSRSCGKKTLHVNTKPTEALSVKAAGAGMSSGHTGPISPPLLNWSFNLSWSEDLQETTFGCYQHSTSQCDPAFLYRVRGEGWSKLLYWPTFPSDITALAESYQRCEARLE